MVENSKPKVDSDICKDCPTFFEGCEGSNQEDCARRPKPDAGLLTEEEILAIDVDHPDRPPNPDPEAQADWLASIAMMAMKASNKAQYDLTISRFNQAVKDSIAGKPLDLTEEEFGIFCAIENMYIDRISKVKDAECQVRVDKLKADYTEYIEARKSDMVGMAPVPIPHSMALRIRRDTLDFALKTFLDLANK